MADDIADDPVPDSPVRAKKSLVKAKKGPKVKKDDAASKHPPTAQMVDNAIKNLKGRGGSSLRAIKKFIATKYEVDAAKLAPFIRKYLKSAVNKGHVVQTKGKGAAGSFKLNPAVKEKKAKVVKPKKQPASEKKVKTKTVDGKPKKAAAAKEKNTKTPKALMKKKAKSSTKEKKAMANKPNKSPKEKKQPTKKKAPAKKTSAKKTPAMKAPLKKAAAKKI
ncbi:Hypothetical predicted protein [Cloeon dipterum]|uniref:H15 domain-containing protein n=1 Tax=Cloeon dipterum TaxID=197152 RepID=A0A8S1CCU1_9INSE|nr:Hypothetical predicted protein [Cloeon dipterum]